MTKNFEIRTLRKKQNKTKKKYVNKQDNANVSSINVSATVIANKLQKISPFYHPNPCI